MHCSAVRGMAILIGLVFALGAIELTLVCFNPDGRVAAEAASLDHHGVPSDDPCVDAAFTGVINGDPGLAKAGAPALNPSIDLARFVVQRRGIESGNDAVDAQLSLSRSTVLRL